MKVVPVILTLLLPALATAQSSSTAESYRIAGSQVSGPRADAERFVLDHVMEIPLDATAAQVLQKAEKSLALFDAASELTFGDWGLDESDPTYGGRELKGMPELADLVVLRARFHAAKPDLDAALADCRRIALLSSRMSVQPSLTRQIQQSQVMRRALEMAASLLPQLTPKQIEEFTASLRLLRGPADPVVVAQTEQESYLWLYGMLINDNQIRRITSRAAGMLNTVFGITTQPIDVEDLARDPARAEQVLAQTREVFAKMIEALKSDPGERDAAMKIIPMQYDFLHPLSRGASQIVLRIYRQHEEQLARMDMFFAAAAICADPARPIDAERARGIAGRFKFVPAEGGFELRWKPGADEMEEVLHVGPRAVLAPPTTNAS